MPKNVLDTILERLDLLSDYLQFSVVCKPWYYVAKDCKKQQRAKMMSSGYPPMLLIHTNEDDTWILYNVMENKVLDLQLGVPHNYKQFCGSAKGWLIAMDENLVVTLINPFLRVKGRREQENSIIRLPSLTHPLTVRGRDFWGKNYKRFVYKATITADPILNADDCIVVVIYEELCRLAFIRISKDTTWTYIGEKYRLFEEVAYVDGEFYAVDHWSQLLYFEITSQLNSDIDMFAHGVERNRKWFTKIYLVDSNDKELLLVHRYINYPDDKRKTKKFRVFAFDFSTFEWKEKNTLGDGALFLGDNSSVYVSASKFFPGCKPNRIYFNHDRDRSYEHRKPHDFGVYNLTNSKFSVPYNSRAMNLLTMTSRYPIWILPTFQL